MTGPQHYKEAEALIRYADTSDDAPIALAEAQIHATLALAAATAEAAGLIRSGALGISPWGKAIES